MIYPRSKIFLPLKPVKTVALVVTLICLVLLSLNHGHRRLDSLARCVQVKLNQVQARMADGVTNVCFPSGPIYVKYYLVSVAPLG